LRFASAFSTLASLPAALDEACGAVVDEIDARIELAFVFFSSEYRDDPAAAGMSMQDMAASLVDRLGTNQVLGCCGESIIANQYELQWQPAISVWAAALDNLRVDTCHLQFQTLGDDAAFVGWTDALSGSWSGRSTLFVLADPYSFPMDVFLHRMNEDRDSLPVIGGMASGVSQPGEARLILGDRVCDRGAVLARIDGDFDVDFVVSQGCRPIGRPFVITRAERNEIHELGGQTAWARLQSVFQSLPNRERRLVNQGLHVGRVISEYIDRPGQGDFLIRNVLKIDEETGSIAIADFVRPGQTVQFQIRDHATAHAELKHLLTRCEAAAATPCEAALMFNCNGRGTRMFPVPHHDARLLGEIVGAVPVAGLFAAGEVGPVGGRNFLHGFTTSIALFRERGITAGPGRQG
jgi:small ligand-binding sensory domain FIST